MTRIKICGMTRVSDACAAADLGVDAIGLVFWPRSPRCVTLEEAGRIAAAMPPFVTVVGVFVNQDAAEIERVARRVGLGAVQLHGDEPEAAWLQLPYAVIKAVPVDAAFDPLALAAWPSRVTPLLDASDRERRGGTGVRADWGLAARAAAVRPVVLAGGLTAGTVGEALAAVRPAAVDVSSGVEDGPGLKNVERLSRFVRAVRRHDESR